MAPFWFSQRTAWSVREDFRRDAPNSRKDGATESDCLVPPFISSQDAFQRITLGIAASSSSGKVEVIESKKLNSSGDKQPLSSRFRRSIWPLGGLNSLTASD
jgi:hypothetical protein